MSSAADPPAAGSSNTQNGPTVSKAKAPLRPIPAWLAPLRFMGVPPSVLRWQPRLPSRTWSIFLSLSISLTSLYLYDRSECKKIKQRYQQMVSHLAQEEMRPNQWPRKLSVFTAKCPGEDGSEEAVIYFKKYVKPILVAAAIDWDLTNGTRHGGLAREITERIYSRRRQLLGLEPFPIFQSSSNNNTSPVDPDTPPPPFSLTPQEQLQRELDGAVVLVGRSTLKEFQWGLREGWTTPCTKTKIDRDESLAKILADDGTFDELERKYEEEQREKREKERGDEAPSRALGNDPDKDEVFLGEEDGAGAPLPSRLNPSVSHMGMNFNVNPAFNPNNSNNNNHSKSSSNSDQEKREEILLPPDLIPAQPPLHLIPYEPLHGWRNIPVRLVGFFNHRKRFEMGGKEGVRIALSFKENAREIEIESNPNPSGNYDSKIERLISEGWRNDDGNWLNEHFLKDQDLKVTPSPQGGDLDFNLSSESKIPPYFSKIPSSIEKSREGFHSNLYDRYKATREISEGLREPSRNEKGPGGKLNVKTVFELKEERFKKEKEWRGEEHGYEIVRLDRGVAWSEKFRGSIRIGRSWEEIKEEAERFGRENTRKKEELEKVDELERKESEEKKKSLDKEV